MQIFKLKIQTSKRILALGAEFDSSFACYNDGKVIISKNTKDKANNPILLEKEIKAFYKDAWQNVSVAPDLILTDLNPEYNTTKIGAKLARQLNIPHIKIQHHIAHMFAVIAEHYLLRQSTIKETPDQFIGIACDGTGYGADGTIWGGEVLLAKSQKPILNLIKDKSQLFRIKNIRRVGYLEKQTLIGGQIAIEEPARMLIAILTKFLNERQIYNIIDKFYPAKIYQLLCAQFKQNFNCWQTSSCARVFDAASALLFGCNERNFKHQAAKILEKNSSKSYNDIQPIITRGIESFHQSKEIVNVLQAFCRSPLNRNCCGIATGSFGDVVKATSCGGAENNILVLQTTPLFKYLIKNLNRDKKRLAATVHNYIANGLFKIAKQQKAKNKNNQIIFSGGMANNKIFRQYFQKNNVLLNQNIEPGDYGISLGQIGWYFVGELCA